jgi:predicted nucleic acid-binding protein
MDTRHITYFDASAAVKLAVKEPGHENVCNHFRKYYRHYMTNLCFAEALGALKGKVHRKELSRERYFYACDLLITYLRHGRFHLDETLEISPETFLKAEHLAQKHQVDLSDALQIVTVRDGHFKQWGREAKTVLATADAGLVKAAKEEGLRVWNVIDSPEPPGWP